MSETIKITFNGKEIQAPAGATIRAVAESQGVPIPTFCHDDRLKPFASCFLCVVEVERARGLLPACSTQVGPGMVIHTDSEKVTSSRKMALDLLLSDHAGDCIAPCEATCPANIDIQGYIAHIANGHFEAAVRLIKQRNPLPVVCGRICPHPCESQCRRTLVDEPVAINPLKRFSSEFELKHGPFVVAPGADTGHKVAIVGGGPAGVSAAFFLRQQGHAVEIFEALPELGGMARYGIPRFRLPWDLMDQEIKTTLDMGVTVHHGQRLGEDFTIADLKSRGFGAILLAIGAHKAKPMRVANEEVPGVIGGVDFLRKAVLEEPVGIQKGSRVAVIGGGDTAMDCARVARRLGAEATLLYRRTQAEMPALEIEQEETEEEGVVFRFLTAPSEVVVEDGHAVGLRVITMRLGEPDDSGRHRPVPIEGSEEVLPFDLIIAAIGQDPDLSCLDNEKEKPETTRWKTFVYDVKTCTTSMDGVFSAGDCAFGPDIVIRAVGEGRRAAMSMDLYLRGAKISLTKPYAISRGRLEALKAADFEPRYVHKKRALESVLPASERLNNGGGWDAINVGLADVQAMAEASRCIECGCNARFDCDLRKYATQYEANETRLGGAKRVYVEDARHPLIRIEPDKCITCASCVRVCSEVREVNALTFIGRGFDTRIAPNFDDPLLETACDACGMCTDLCPTGTLSPNTGKASGPWLGSVTLSSCTGCSLGCGLDIHTAEQSIVKVCSVDGDPVNGACICAEGRFAYQLLASSEENVKANTAVDDARALVAKAGHVSVVVAPQSTVEEIYLASRVAEAKGGRLFHPQSGDVQGAAKARGKIRNEANLALLQRLGATPWQEDEAADALVMVGCRVTARGVDAAHCIVVDSHDVDGGGGMGIQVADPLLSEGAFLNREGDLVLLRPAFGGGQGAQAGFRVLAQLMGDSELAELAVVRRKLTEKVPELASLNTLNGGRIIKTSLAPVLAASAPSGRQLAFVAHMEKMGLAWT